MPYELKWDTVKVSLYYRETKKKPVKSRYEGLGYINSVLPSKEEAERAIRQIYCTLKWDE